MLLQRDSSRNNELHATILDLTKDFDKYIVTDHTHVEILPPGVNKGAGLKVRTVVKTWSCFVVNTTVSCASWHEHQHMRTHTRSA